MSEERVTILTRKDLDISYFKGSGDGGQKKQKTASGVQIIHRETGAIGRASDTRSQLQNKKLAFKRLVESPKMKVWLNRKIFEIRSGEAVLKRIEREVERSMAPENLKIEYF
jgi:protein subunit release factor B